MGRISMTKYIKKIKKATQNTYFQYFVYLLAGINVLYVLTSNDFLCIGAFIFTAVCMLVYSKNIIVTLVVWLVICNMYIVTYHTQECFKGFFKKKKRKQQEPEVTDSPETGDPPAENGDPPAENGDPPAANTEENTKKPAAEGDTNQKMDSLIEDMNFLKKQLSDTESKAEADADADADADE